MPTDTQSPDLADLDFIPYVDDDGLLPSQFARTVGVYAIFNQDRVLQFVGYSRDVAMSLKQHLVRCPDACYWFKLKTIERPQKSVLEAIQAAWIEEYGDRPSGNGEDAERWTQPIDAMAQMTDEERASYAATTTEIEQAKARKQVARRVEAELQKILEDRGVNESIRFDPKLKERGLLNIKPTK